MAPSNWNYFIAEQQKNNKEGGMLLNMLLESAFTLNEESSALCLSLCTLALDSDEERSVNTAK